MNDYLQEEEMFFNITPKYRKKGKRKKTEKAKHKHKYHKYIGVIHEYEINNKIITKYFPVSICEKCDKIGNVGLWFTKKTADNYCQVLNDLDEIKNEYPKLEIQEFDKFPW